MGETEAIEFIVRKKKARLKLSLARIGAGMLWGFLPRFIEIGSLEGYSCSVCFVGFLSRSVVLGYIGGRRYSILSRRDAQLAGIISGLAAFVFGSILSAAF